MRILRLLAVTLLVLGALAASGWGYLRWQSGVEAARLSELLAIGKGAVVAEIGAGDGSFTVKFGQLVGPTGRIYSTEIEDNKQQAIRDAARAAALGNVEVRPAHTDATNLPAACCDAVFLRHVYHHVSDPEPFARSLLESTRPGGLLAVIDFSPGGLLSWLPAVEGAPADRGGHGISPALVVSELTAAGFEIVERIDDWYNVDFCVIARRPERTDL